MHLQCRDIQQFKTPSSGGLRPMIPVSCDVNRSRSHTALKFWLRSRAHAAPRGFKVRKLRPTQKQPGSV